MRNGKTSLVSCTSIIFRLKQSIKFTFCAFCSWENKKSYQTFFYYDAYYIQHLQLHVLQFPFKIVVMMTQLVLSIFCLLLPSLLLFLIAHSHTFSFLFLYSLPLWIERLPFFEWKYCISYAMAHPDGRFGLFASCSVYLDF